MLRKRLFGLLILLATTAGFAAELSLPTVFSDHMVLQREKPVPVWGTADPGATVSVEFAGQKKSTVASESGTWQVKLDPMPASSEPRILKVSSSQKSATENRQFSDVLVGEVWLCSGQSNMQWSMERTENAEEAIPKADHPQIRFYLTPIAFAKEPKDKINGQWEVCSPQTVPPLSGVAYYFGKKLKTELNVPIGLLQSAWGGTRIEPWTPPSGFEGIDSLADIREKIKNIPPEYGKDPKKVKQERQYPTLIYNAMLHAHIPYAIRGAIWYQGESNHREPAMLYRDKTEALLKGWRGLWGYNFPYYFVQIAPFQYGSEDPSVLAEFWEAQAEIVKTIPNTGMAVVSDATTLNNIHPPNKEVPGTRLALLALDNTYGQDLISTGPTFKKMEIKDGTIEITFDSAEGLTTRDGKAPDWFEIGGKEGVYKKATAEIKGNKVILSSPEVEKPLAMRFAWHKLATPNLVNAAGLPAPAFRAGELPEPKLPDSVQLPEMEGYRTVYRLQLDANANFANSAPAYDIDNSDDGTPFTKVAYLLELQKTGGDVDYAFVSTDAFTDDLKKIGLPTASSGARFFEKVNNLTVRSNVEGIQTVTDSDGGNIEFWPGNYAPANENKIPGASEKIWDFGDAPVDKIPGYSCMQVHNWKGKQTVFAINKWGSGGTLDIGIGNSDTKRAADWTFTSNAGQYSLRRLTVLVK